MPAVDHVQNHLLSRARRALRDDRMRHISIGAALVALTIGIGTLIGWYANVPALLRARESFVAIQFNTGICFTLCGASLLCLRFKRLDLCVVFAALLLVLSGATLVEHIGNWDFGIDLALWHLGVDRTTMGELVRLRQSAPGRMAPNSALAFVMLALAHLIAALPRITTRRMLASAILLVGATTLGGIALAGYLISVPTAYGWGHLTRMALQTSVGLSVLALGSLAAVLLIARGAALPVRRYLSSMSGITVAVAAVITWQALLDYQLFSLDEALRLQASGAASIVSRSIDERAKFVDRIAHSTLALDATRGVGQQRSASPWLAAYAGLASIRLIDSSGRMRREFLDSTSVDGSSMMRIAPAPVPQALLLRARAEGHAIISAPIRRAGHLAVVLLVAPIRSARDARNAFIVADVVPSIVLSHELPNELTAQYEYALYDGEQHIASFPRAQSERPPGSPVVSVNATMRGRQWQVRVAPTQKTIDDSSSGVPFFFLIASLICAQFTFWVVRAAQRADGQAIRLARSVEDLAAENERRREAELSRDRQEMLLSLQSKELERQHEKLQTTATELEEQRDALTREKEFGTALVRSTVDAVAAFDFMGRVHAWNPAMGSLTGRPMSEVQGTVMGHLLPFLEGEQEARFVEEALSGRVSELHSFPATHELWNQNVRLDLMVTPMRASDGKVVGGLFVARDVTERERVSSLILASKESAEQANRTKSEFLARMSHELRTPLNAVIGFTNVLRRNRENRMGRDEMTYLDRIGANGRHLLSLINEVLDLAKIEAGHETIELATTPVVVLVRETLADLDIRASEAGVSLQLDAPACAEAITDGKKLKQVVINLVANAIKFTPKGGRVTVRVHADADDGTARRIDVTDTGIGIPKDRLEAIFEAFEQADEQTSRVYGGTGLGLSISLKLCVLMGHDLRVESEPGAGSTFSIVLQPAAAPNVRKVAASRQH